MGTKSRDKRKRRELAQQGRAQAIQAEVIRGSEQYRAMVEQVFTPEAAQFHEADRHGQAVRLTDDGWRQAVPGPDGMGRWVNNRRGLTLIHSVGCELDGEIWAHISIGHASGSMPDWYLVRDAAWLMYPGRFGVVVIAPSDQHVNLNNIAHVWVCLTKPSCPDFSHGTGSI